MNYTTGRNGERKKKKMTHLCCPRPCARHLVSPEDAAPMLQGKEKNRLNVATFMSLSGFNMCESIKLQFCGFLWHLPERTDYSQVFKNNISNQQGSFLLIHHYFYSCKMLLQSS